MVGIACCCARAATGHAAAAPPSSVINCRRLMRTSVKAHTAALVPIASRVLHFLQLLLSLDRRRANPISKGHVGQSKRQQCSCDTGCRAPNGNLRGAVGHLPIIVRGGHRPSLTANRRSNRTISLPPGWPVVYGAGPELL